ncbi:TPA: ead/Ea22-like family protein [Escherichia coli]|nr:ead/Ea22-like family protein [Escherichia coli]EEW2044711.1 ead/Ea22-like family protein [Escherichia coli]EFE8684689.1 ead/Ea22-like family protein [Escherichia coli]EFH9121277.1 ead/Ea22-like family protein [Escherichia coli]EFN3843098.1 ead/Ea22-like family protein [Escherichia coli]
MSKIDYQALRAKAEKATCGEWSLEYGEGRFDGDDALIHREVVGYLPICRIEGAHPESGFDEDFQMEQQANAEFIAAANPATVLALLDELERNQQYIKSRDQENEDIALTVGKLRVELEGKDKLIAELGKQCAEWERKASSNFEECAAMAERIEELEKATTGQDANINSQQERVAQSANRHVYHYNAVSNVSGITMSGIAQSPFRIKSQSDLEEFKSALSKVCGFHATAVTSLSYLGREEEEQNDEKP